MQKEADSGRQAELEGLAEGTGLRVAWLGWEATGAWASFFSWETLEEQLVTIC